jgi:hypothetical protein
MNRREWLAACVLTTVAAVAHAQADEPDGPRILHLATEAHGGDDWAKVRTLMLAGRAEFWGLVGAQPRSRAERYQMWRVFDPDRTAAHGAEGKVRIVAESAGKTPSGPATSASASSATRSSPASRPNAWPMATTRVTRSGPCA